MSSQTPDQPDIFSPTATDSDLVRTERSLAQAFVDHLAALGVEHAFGISGGAISLIFDALVESPVQLHHFRHETGAAFAATEAYFATQRPTLVFATTGPGTLNALTGMTAAKWDGAKVILITGSTSSPQRGRWATQETSSYTLPQDALYAKGPLFDFALRMEQVSEFPEVIRRLSLGLSRPGGFIAHISLPMSIQSHRIEGSPSSQAREMAFSSPVASREDIAWCASLLKRSRFAIWVGFGATHAAPLVHRLVENSAAPVFCSPRGKGVFPEDHPRYIGVTGLGGHEEVTEYMIQRRPEWILVLGTRLGEATSFWDPDMCPTEGFIHVDLDPKVPGTAFPDCDTVGIHAEIGQFLTALLKHFPNPVEGLATPEGDPLPRPTVNEISASEPRKPVRPQALMGAVQRQVIDNSQALVMSECGNAFAWCNHYLRFKTPGRYRVSTLFGSMGHTAAGVVGAALARRGKAVAIVGDGSMLMNSEVSTAVQYQAAAVWIILNDSGYGMCREGHRTLGLSEEQIDIPTVDFAGLAISLGANGLKVEYESELETAICHALKAPGPFVIDVRIDSDEASPLIRRFESLLRQGTRKSVSGWEL